MKTINSSNSLVEKCPDILALWDYDKNEKLNPHSVSPATHSKVWWKCDRGHSYQSAPYSRTGFYKFGCPYCTGRKVLQGFNDLETLKPDLAWEGYYPLNGDLKPPDVTLGSNKKVWWCCSDNHVWEACVFARTRFKGSGCPVCAGIVKTRKIKYFIDDGYIRYKGHN